MAKKTKSKDDGIKDLAKQIGQKLGEETVGEIRKAAQQLGYLTVASGEINRENGFLAPTNIDTRDSTIWMMAIMGLIASEVGEAIEALRIPDRRKAREAFEEEIADIIIRILHMAHFLRMDVHKAVEKKLDKIKDREFLHGKYL